MDNTEDGTILAVMEFIHFYDPKVSVQRLVNGSSFYSILKTVPQFGRLQSNFNFDVSKWSKKVTNLSSLLQKINEYFEIKEKGVVDDDIDLMNLCKNESLGEVKKMFEVVMSVLMEASNKEQYIQRIMELGAESQEQFVQLIKNSLQVRVCSGQKTKQDRLISVIYELQDEKLLMQVEIERLCKGNKQLLLNIQEYEQKIEEIEQSVSEREQTPESSFHDDSSQIKYYENYIEKLTKKLFEVEQQKQTLSFKITDNQLKLNKFEQLEDLCKIYKEKYDQIMEQFSKMNIWSKEKSKMEKINEEKEFTIRKLQDRIDELVERNLTLEESQINLKLEDEKKSVRLRKIESEMKKSIVDQHNLKNNLDLSMKQNHSHILEDEDEKYEMKKNLQKLQKENRNMTKEMVKLRKTSDKAKLLEEDKKKLELVVSSLKSSYEKEINVLVAALQETYFAREKLKKSKIFS